MLPLIPVMLLAYAALYIFTLKKKSTSPPTTYPSTHTCHLKRRGPQPQRRGTQKSTKEEQCLASIPRPRHRHRYLGTNRHNHLALIPSPRPKPIGHTHCPPTHIYRAQHSVCHTGKPPSHPKLRLLLSESLALLAAPKGAKTQNSKTSLQKPKELPPKPTSQSERAIRYGNREERLQVHQDLCPRPAGEGGCGALVGERGDREREKASIPGQGWRKEER
jgi:hypothetical protein